MEPRSRPSGVSGIGRFLLVLVPTVASAGLSGSMFYAYVERVTWLASCRSFGMGTSCVNAPGFWLLGAVLWAAIAACLLGLLRWTAQSTRAGRAIVFAGSGLVGWCLANLGLGAAGAWIGEAASYGEAPYDVGYAVYLLFVTLGLLLFGLGSVYWPFLEGKWAPLAKVLAVVNGFLGIGFGIVFVKSVLDPGIVFA